MASAYIRRVCEYLQNNSTKERLSKKIAYLCFVLCVAHTDILKRSAISLYSVDVKLDTLLRNIGIIRKGALLGCIRTRVPFCLVRVWCIRILHTSKRGCQFILSILQEVQAYIEDKTGFGGPALFQCFNLNKQLTAQHGLKAQDWTKHTKGNFYAKESRLLGFPPAQIRFNQNKMTMEYYNIILMYTISDDTTRTAFVHEIEQLYETTVPLDQSCLGIATCGTIEKIQEQITKICNDYTFKKGDYVSLYCTATFARIQGKQDKIVRYNIELQRNLISFKAKNY